MGEGKGEGRWGRGRGRGGGGGEGEDRWGKGRGRGGRGGEEEGKGRGRGGEVGGRGEKGREGEGVGVVSVMLVHQLYNQTVLLPDSHKDCHIWSFYDGEDHWKSTQAGKHCLLVQFQACCGSEVAVTY